MKHVEAVISFTKTVVNALTDGHEAGGSDLVDKEVDYWVDKVWRADPRLNWHMHVAHITLSHHWGLGR